MFGMKDRRHFAQREQMKVFFVVKTEKTGFLYCIFVNTILRIMRYILALEQYVAALGFHIDA